MPKNTGIKNRLDYINRVLAEDKKLADEDKVYGAYITALTNLAAQTNEVYANEGNLTKDSYEKLVKAYLDVTEKANAYKVSTLDSESITRMNVVNHIQKIISRDIKALNNMNKENPGKIDTVFENSRAVKVNVPEGFASKVGGQMSDRFAMVSPDGKKGFFTVRTDTAKDEKWQDIIDNKIKPLDLPKGIMKKLNELKTNHKLRSSLKEGLYEPGLSMDQKCANLAKQLGFFSTGTEAERALATDDYQPLRTAMEILVTDAKKLTGPYNMVERLKYDPYTRNDNKNAAMYEVAKFLGCEKLIAKAVPMIAVNGDQVIKGTFMEHAEGSDLADLKADDPLWDYDYKTGAYNPELYNDLADLQLIDYICGNIDRHKCNMFYKTSKDQDGKVKITGLVGIDNDACFPEGDIAKREFDKIQCQGHTIYPKIFKPENFRFVNKKTAEIVQNMTRAQLETLLRGQNISPKAIDKAWDRVNEVKEVLRENKLTFTENIKKGTTSKEFHKNLNDDPFAFHNDFGENPSIFTRFNLEMDSQVRCSKKLAIYDQNKRYEKKAIQKMDNEKLNIEEYKRFKNEEEANKKSAQAEKVTPEQAVFADKNKIETLNAVMKRINKLKFASKEFAVMRKAMYDLAGYHKELSEQIAEEGKKLTSQQLKDYGKRLEDLDKATKEYVMAKGLTPKTEKGRERLEGALKIDHGIEDLIKGFEEVKNMDGVNLDDHDMEYDASM